MRGDLSLTLHWEDSFAGYKSIKPAQYCPLIVTTFSIDRGVDPEICVCIKSLSLIAIALFVVFEIKN